MSGVEVAAWLGKALGAGAEKVITGSGVAAIGRLIGATADIPTAYLEGISQNIRDKSEARSLITKTLAEVAAEKASKDPVIMERALNNMLQKQYRSQENKDAVAKAALEALVSNPPSADKGGPSDQFMTNFERYAEDATSEDLRLMFGRLLAGEIRKPGSVSPASLHFVSMLDHGTAELIKRVLPACSQDAAFLENIQPRLSVAEITYLEQAGFWAADKLLPLTFDGKGALIRIMRKNEGYVCIAEPNKLIQLQLAILSHPGRDLVSATEIPFDYESMAETFFRNGATYFHAGKAKYFDDKVSIPEGDKFKRQADAEGS